MRGTDVLAREQRRDHRFIPACAGNGYPRWFRLTPPPVHPRVCGERPSRPSTRARSIGSSPRVRGTVDNLFALGVVHRFIPACAGNGSSRGPPRAEAAVHPRVCGERTLPSSRRHRTGGSSPRVRGTGRRRPPQARRDRFIPACAGNGAAFGSTLRSGSVHPRVCGERQRRYGDERQPFGSSPRVRGTANLEFVVKGRWRFIPACAGNGCAASALTLSSAVHPRVCGERQRLGCCALCISGSSPRVRGTGTAGAPMPRHCRFIPACAGNGNCRPPPKKPSPVHPRVCGERAGGHDVGGVGVGSSPRVRGTAVPPQFIKQVPRFIPACAGNGCGCCGVGRAPSVHPRVCGER